MLKMIRRLFKRRWERNNEINNRLDKVHLQIALIQARMKDTKFIRG